MKPDETAKSKTRTSHQYPIDFVVPLQLEECVHRIQRYFAKTTDIDIRITRKIDHDTAEFMLRRYEQPPRQIVLHVDGVMRRWEGTSTRFEGQVVAGEWQKAAEPLWILLIIPAALLIGFVFIMFIWLVILLVSMPNPSSSEVTLSLIVSGLVVWFITMFVSSKVYYYALKKHTQDALVSIFVERLLKAPSS